MNYPKILIVGQYFEKRTGGGVTMSNLFKGWDKDKIATVAEENMYTDFNICDNNYRLGSLEIVRRFPFNLRKKKIPSGTFTPSEHSSVTQAIPEYHSSLKFRLYIDFLHFAGLYHYKSRYQISDKFLEWVKEFSPDIIYSQLSTIALIDLVSELSKKLDKQVAIHIMDDWPTTISKKGVLHSYWKKLIDRKFRMLLNKSKVLLSIGESMSNEYYLRYGLNFIPFHNPVDLKFWGVCTKQDFEIKDTFKILYAGRIGPGIQSCFIDIAKALESLINKGLKMELQIQTSSHDPLLEDLKKFEFVKLKEPTAYNELPRVFSNADLLLLPNDFDSKAIKFLKYSMPTKASEYMISGTPILLYSSIETAVTLHAIKYNWAYVVSERSPENLATAITELYENKDLRIKLSNSARECAINNFDDVIIKERFRKSFILDQTH